MKINYILYLCITCMVYSCSLHNCKKGESLYRENKHHEALSYFNKCISQGEFKPLSLELRGRSYLNIGDTLNAMQDLRTSIEQGNRSDAILNTYGDIIMKTGESDSAIPIFLEALEQSHNNPVTLYNLGICYSNVEEYEKALVMLNRYIEVAEDKAKGYYAISQVNFINEKIYDAYDKISVAIELNNQEPVYYTKRGAILAAIEEYSMALEDFEKAFTLSKDFDLSREAIIGKILVLGAMGENSKSCEVYSMFKNKYHIQAETFNISCVE